jgi:hypothetical protein
VKADTISSHEQERRRRRQSIKLADDISATFDVGPNVETKRRIDFDNSFNNDDRSTKSFGRKNLA